MKLYQLTLPEQELTERLKANDVWAFNVLYKSYSSALYGVILKIVRTDPPAEDVLQEAFTKIWKKIHQYEPQKGTLFTWMLNIARNTGIDTIRAKSFKNNLSTTDVAEQAKNIDKNEQTHFKPEYIGVKETAQKLKPEHYELIELIYFQGYSQSEAAEKLNIPLGTVKSRVKSAMAELRKIYLH